MELASRRKEGEEGLDLNHPAMNPSETPRKCQPRIDDAPEHVPCFLDRHRLCDDVASTSKPPSRGRNALSHPSLCPVAFG